MRLLSFAQAAPAALGALAGLASFGHLVAATPVSLERRGTPADEIIQLTSSSNFCLIMPPGPNLIISDHEPDALSYCLPGGTITSTGGRIIPNGFITSAHYVRTTGNEFVQISGTYNPAPFGLIPSDSGGQYDSDGPGCGGKGCPIGSTCAGYGSFIEILGSGQFCVRCCNNPTYCPDNRDTEGCVSLMGGNYGSGFTDGIVSLPASGTALDTSTGTPITPPQPHSLCGYDTQCSSGQKCFQCPTLGWNCGASSESACGVSGVPSSGPAPSPPPSAPHSLCGYDTQCSSGQKCFQCPVLGWNCGASSESACGVSGIPSSGPAPSPPPSTPHSLCGYDTQCSSGQKCFQCPFLGWNCGTSSESACGVSGIPSSGPAPSPPPSTPHSLCGYDTQCSSGQKCFQCNAGGWNCGGSSSAACGYDGAPSSGPAPPPPAPHSLCGYDDQCADAGGYCWTCLAGGWNCGSSASAACGSTNFAIKPAGPKPNNTPHDKCGADSQCGGGKCWECRAGGWNCGANYISACQDSTPVPHAG